MTRTEELYESARLTELHNRTKIVTVSAKDMMQLVELVRLQNSALEFASDFIPASECKVGECEVCEAIAAFNKFEQGGE